MKVFINKFLKIFLILLLFFSISAINILGVEIFINTNPINSQVYIDHNIVGYTPIRLKIDNKDKINIIISKEGYKKLQKIIELYNKRILNLHFDLTPDKIELIFKDKGKIINICGLPVGITPAILYNVPNGLYEIKETRKSYDINPAGYKYAIRSTAIESLYSGGMLTLLLLGMSDFNKKGDDVGVSVTGFGSAVMTAILSYDILKLVKLKIEKEKAKIEVKKIKYKPYEMKDDKVLFTDGIGFLGQKRYRAAAEKFSLLTKLYMNSQYLPISYYELGLCYYNLKDYVSAVDVLNDFLRKYPVYEVYQYAFYYYLDSLLKLKSYNQAYSDYNEFRPVIIEDESGVLYKMYFKTLIELYRKNKGEYKKIMYDILNYINYYSNKYSDSSAYPDIITFKAFILYKYLDRKKGLELIEQLRQIYGKDEKVMKKLKSIVEK